MHSDGTVESKLDMILHVFDCIPIYGPTIGRTRMERWKRAKDLGMEPDDEVSGGRWCYSFQRRPWLTVPDDEGHGNFTLLCEESRSIGTSGPQWLHAELLVRSCHRGHCNLEAFVKHMLTRGNSFSQGPCHCDGTDYHYQVTCTNGEWETKLEMGS